jgi:hypothetical protein
MFKKGCGVEMKRMQEGLLVSPGLFSFFGRIMISKLLLKKKKKKKKKKKVASFILSCCREISLAAQRLQTTRSRCFSPERS